MTTVNINLYPDGIRVDERCANDFNDLRTYSLNACCGESHPVSLGFTSTKDICRTGVAR